MRILQVSNYFPEHVGGIETVAAGLADGYRSAGHEVRWLAGETAGLEHRGHEDDRPFRVWNVTEQRLGFPYPIPGPRVLGALRDAVAWADAVHMHDCLYAANVLTMALARRHRRPVLLTQHVSGPRYTRTVIRGAQTAAYRTVGRAMMRAADQVVFVSEPVAAAFRDVAFRRPPAVVTNGVDTAAFAPHGSREDLRRSLDLPEDEPVLLLVGRFVAKKGLDHVRQVAEDLPEVRVVMVGRADDDDPRRWALDNVIVRDAVPQSAVASYYGSADALLLLSQGEGFPVSVQEAASCGLPPIVSPSIREAAGPVASLLETVDPEARELPRIVATALDTVRGDPTLGSRLREAAVTWWSRDAAVAAYLRLLRSLVEANGEYEK